MIPVNVRQAGVNVDLFHIDSDASIADLRELAHQRLIKKGLAKAETYEIRLVELDRYPDPDTLVNRYLPQGDRFIPVVVELVPC